MSHKINPKLFKIKGMQDWLSRGFYNKKFPLYLQKDLAIRNYLRKKLAGASVEDIIIERHQNSLKIAIRTARPALVIGRGGEGVTQIKKEILDIIKKGLNKGEQKALKDVKIEIIEVKNPRSSASLTAQWMASQIEKKVMFRRVLKMAISRLVEQKEVKGAKVQVSGRLNGVEIARTEWLKQGKLPRQNLRAIIDYGFSEARCTYGTIGIKVWVYKGEKFD